MSQFFWFPPPHVESQGISVLHLLSQTLWLLYASRHGPEPRDFTHHDGHCCTCADVHQIEEADLERDLERMNEADEA